ncbi:MAG: hypothetical protein L3J07_01450 [Candidatus Magasanikbacteria bacterium]|nr:hypothetical protein [Candidatus Magasanikbacteria bacterium]
MNKFFEFFLEFVLFVLSLAVFAFIAKAHYSHVKINSKYVKERNARKARLF